MRKVFHLIYSLLFLFIAPCFMYAQDASVPPPSGQLVDKVVAIVGDKIILKSDMDERIQEYVNEKGQDTTGISCRVLEDLMYEKLLLIEAQKDSTIIVSDDQVNQEFDKRIGYYIHEFGSKEAFEKWYGKSVEQYKEELKPDVRDLLMAQQMRSKVLEGITISPEGVRKYYEAIPQDSIPSVDAQEEVAQIVKLAALTPEEKQIAKDKCEELRQQVIKGDDMAALAVLYSGDPGSSKNGGEYKNVRHGDFGGNEFEKMAFSLKDSEISPVFETQFGYHFIQLVRRHGELLDLRHILIIPLVSDIDMEKCKEQLDTIKKLIKRDTLTFADAAAKYSDDKGTKYNGGVITNPQTGLTKWDMNQLGELELSYTITMNPGDISDPEMYSSPDAKRGYRIVMLKSRSKPHKANLKDDYQQIQAAALSKKQQKVVNDWINRKLKEGVYVHVDKGLQQCKFQNNWLNPQPNSGGTQ
jgi:peptidyl-prolyl cis-trans isomerase SurA